MFELARKGMLDYRNGLLPLVEQYRAAAEAEMLDELKAQVNIGFEAYKRANESKLTGPRLTKAAVSAKLEIFLGYINMGEDADKVMRFLADDRTCIVDRHHNAERAAAEVIIQYILSSTQTSFHDKVAMMGNIQRYLSGGMYDRMEYGKFIPAPSGWNPMRTKGTSMRECLFSKLSKALSLLDAKLKGLHAITNPYYAPSEYTLYERDGKDAWDSLTVEYAIKENILMPYAEAWIQAQRSIHQAELTPYEAVRKSVQEAAKAVASAEQKVAALKSSSSLDRFSRLEQAEPDLVAKKAKLEDLKILSSATYQKLSEDAKKFFRLEQEFKYPHLYSSRQDIYHEILKNAATLAEVNERIAGFVAEKVAAKSREFKDRIRSLGHEVTHGAAAGASTAVDLEKAVSATYISSAAGSAPAFAAPSAPSGAGYSHPDASASSASVPRDDGDPQACLSHIEIPTITTRDSLQLPSSAHGAFDPSPMAPMPFAADAAHAQSLVAASAASNPFDAVFEEPREASPVIAADNIFDWMFSASAPQAQVPQADAVGVQPRASSQEGRVALTFEELMDQLPQIPTTSPAAQSQQQERASESASYDGLVPA